MAYEWAFDLEMQRDADGVWRRRDDRTVFPLPAFVGPALVGAGILAAASFCTGFALGSMMAARNTQMHWPQQRQSRRAPRVVRSRDEHFSPG